MELTTLIYELARTNKRIKSYYYGKAYEKGAGNDNYPLFWLDDPIAGQSAGQNPPQRLLRWTCNLDILGIPEDDGDVTAVQSAAFNTGLGVIERITAMRPAYGWVVESLTFISLRDYYDDKAAGYRFSYTMVQTNPVNRCADDWDPNKQLQSLSPLPEMDTDAATGCAVFTDRTVLPNFTV